MAAVRWREVRQGDTIMVEEIHKVVVHKFSIGDVEDPDLYAAGPIWDWQESDQGKFVMNHAIDKPEWHRNLDHASHYGYQYAITAELEAKKLSEFYLRWGKDGSGKIR
jgi:hypothetical protein